MAMAEERHKSLQISALVYTKKTDSSLPRSGGVVACTLEYRTSIGPNHFWQAGFRETDLKEQSPSTHTHHIPPISFPNSQFSVLQRTRTVWI